MAKRPETKRSPRAAKQPSRGDADPSVVYERPLSWALVEAEVAGKWGWHKLAQDQLLNLYAKLLDYERASLHTLRRERRARQIPTEHLTDEAQRRLERKRRDDAEIWELRLGHEKWRVWGTIRGSIFYMLWWDPDHTVCRGMPQGVRRS